MLEGAEYVAWKSISNLSIYIETAMRELPSQRTNDRICENKVYEVEPYGHIHIPLIVQPGEVVRGHLSELNGYDFGYLIIDSTNLAKYLRDENFTAAKEEYDVVADDIKWKVHKGRKGPWFLLLDASMKRIEREIQVYLVKD